MLKDTAVIILAAGLGTRMMSDKAKVLHDVLGKPMITYVVETAGEAVGNNIIAVVGHQAEKVRQVINKTHDILFAFQEEQLGTGHAVQCALPYLTEKIKDVIILCGDVPLLTSQTILKLAEDHARNRRVVSVLAVQLDDPTGYGRMLVDEDGNVSQIVEQADATDAQKCINIINTGVYCVNQIFLKEALSKLQANNAQGEYYLTDIVKIANEKNQVVGMMLGENAVEFSGINSVEHLKAVEAVLEAG
ncbi:MAG: NTP transferase domain-containing protein [Desulfobacterales bacterium]|nr:NTP transferase domain-containing protein [Desulfobacterales bacterium]